MGVGEVEVITPWDKKAVRFEILSVLQKVMAHDVHLFISIKGAEILVNNDRVSIHASFVISESLRLMVMVRHSMGKNLNRITKRL